jgi:hypothetical protein
MNKDSGRRNKMNFQIFGEGEPRSLDRRDSAHVLGFGGKARCSEQRHREQASSLIRACAVARELSSSVSKAIPFRAASFRNWPNFIARVDSPLDKLIAIYNFEKINERSKARRRKKY